MATELLGHLYGVCFVKFSPCGRFLVSCSWDDNVGVWDVSTGTLLYWLKGHCSPVSACTFMSSPSSGTLLVVGVLSWWYFISAVHSVYPEKISLFDVKLKRKTLIYIE